MLTLCFFRPVFRSLYFSCLSLRVISSHCLPKLRISYSQTHLSKTSSTTTQVGGNELYWPTKPKRINSLEPRPDACCMLFGELAQPGLLPIVTFLLVVLGNIQQQIECYQDRWLKVGLLIAWLVPWLSYFFGHQIERLLGGSHI